MLFVMSTESKLWVGVIASFLTGLLVTFHVVDPTQANTVAGYMQSIGGAVLIVIPPLIALEALLFKHKAEVSSQHLLDTPSAPVEPVAPVDPATPQPQQ